MGAFTPCPRGTSEGTEARAGQGLRGANTAEQSPSGRPGGAEPEAATALHLEDGPTALAADPRCPQVGSHGRARRLRLGAASGLPRKHTAVTRDAGATPCPPSPVAARCPAGGRADAPATAPTARRPRGTRLRQHGLCEGRAKLMLGGRWGGA